MPTYNHEKYISQAIDSALAQKTGYDWELLINDDCSTDGTLKIAEEYASKYPEKIRLFKQEKNQGLLKSYKFLLSQAKGKYIAILESDDKWSNPEKLEKQISFLESHDEYGLCCSDYENINESGEVLGDVIKDFDRNQNDDWYDALMSFASIGALTIVFRKSIFDEYCFIDDYIDRKFQTFDRATWLSIARHSKCHFIHENLASYRVMSSSISNSGSFEKALSFANSIMDIHEYVIGLYGLGSISRKDFDEMKKIWFVNLSINHRQYKYFKKVSSTLAPTSIKHALMRYLPKLWWMQYTLRHPMPRHLK